MNTVAAVAVTFALSACSATPDAGQEAVLVSKPWFFGHGGVDDEPVKAGRAFIAPSTQAIYVDVKPAEWDVKFSDLMSKDGVPLHFDATIVLQVTDSVGLIKNFGDNWYGNNIDSVFRNRVRQAVRKYGMNEVAIDTSAVEAIDNEVTAAMQTYIAQAKIPVRLIRLTVGKANPPDSVKDQRVKTAQEEQRRKTEDMTRQAEDARKAAEASRAAADNAYRGEMGLSPQQFVELERIHMMKDACSKETCTFIIGNASPVVTAKN